MKTFKIATEEIRFAMSVFRRETMRTWKYEHDDLVQEAAIKVTRYFEDDDHMERFRSASDGEKAMLLKRVFATVTLNLAKKNVAIPISTDTLDFEDPEPTPFDKISKEQEAEENRAFLSKIFSRLTRREKDAVLYRAGAADRPSISQSAIQTYIARARKKAKGVRRG